MRSPPTRRKAKARAATLSDGDAAASGPVDRLFAVLRLAAKMGMVSAADVVYMLDLPRPTAHRLIANLESLGLLQKMPVKGKYAASPKLVGLATSILASTIVYAPIHSILTLLEQRTGETCALSIMASGHIEYIASVMGQSPLTLQFQEGQKAPLHCTSSGMVFLAGLDEEALAAFLASGPWEAMTDHTITDPRRMRERLQKVRQEGFAANDSEYIVGVVGAAVPIRNREGQLIAALTISAPRSRRTLQDIVGLVPTLKTFGDRLSRIL